MSQMWPGSLVQVQKMGDKINSCTVAVLAAVIIKLNPVTLPHKVQETTLFSQNDSIHAIDMFWESYYIPYSD